MWPYTHHGLRLSARSADRQESHEGHHRIQPDRGRRSGDGRLVRRQGQLGAAADPRRPAPARADLVLAGRRHRRFRLRRLPPRSDLEHLRSARLGVPDHPHRDRRGDGGSARQRRDAVLAVRAAPPRRALPAGHRSRRHQDRARPSPRRLHRDAAPEPVLRRRTEGDAGPARLRQRRARGHPSAGRRHRSRRRDSTRRSERCRSSAAAVRRAATSACSASASSGSSRSSRSSIPRSRTR